MNVRKLLKMNFARYREDLVDDLHEEIAKVAYELFERDGRRHGLDKEHWLEAERIVKARHEAQEASEPKKKVSREPRRQPVSVKKAERQKERQLPQRSDAIGAGRKGKKIVVKPENK
jgi:hypothetical protein